jgi:hypothetical protein
MTTPPRCGAKTRSGTACQQVSGWGCGPLAGVPGARCRLHGGLSPSGKKAGERHAAEHAVAVFGLPRSVDPHVALKQELSRVNGHVTWLADLIAGFESSDGLKQYALGEGALWEKPSVWYEIYARERKHLVLVAAECIRCGIAEREVALAEAHGKQLADALQGILDEVGVIPSEDLALIVGRHLRRVSGRPGTTDSTLN